MNQGRKTVITAGLDVPYKERTPTNKLPLFESKRVLCFTKNGKAGQQPESQGCALMSSSNVVPSVCSLSDMRAIKQATDLKRTNGPLQFWKIPDYAIFVKGKQVNDFWVHGKGWDVIVQYSAPLCLCDEMSPRPSYLCSIPMWWTVLSLTSDCRNRQRASLFKASRGDGPREHFMIRTDYKTRCLYPGAQFRYRSFHC